MARLCDEHTVVCALQNGVAQGARGRFCPSSTVLPAAVWISAEPHPGGWVRLRTDARLTLTVNDVAESLAGLFRGAGITVDLDADFTTAASHKLLVNAVVGLMVLTGRRSGMFRRDDVAAWHVATSPNALRSPGPRAPTSTTR